MTKVELEQWVRDNVDRFGLADHTETIISWIRPTALIERDHSSDDEIPIAASKSGGQPDVKPGFRWPRTSEEGRWMHFVMQIDCRDLEECGLRWPTEGLLQFFADDYNSDAEFHLEFSSDTKGLARAAFSPEQPELSDEKELSPARLSFEPAAMLPEDDFALAQRFEAAKRFQFIALVDDLEMKLEDEIEDLDERVGGYPTSTLSNLMWTGLQKRARDIGVEVKNHASLMNNTAAGTRDRVLALYSSVDLLLQTYWPEGKLIFVATDLPEDPFSRDRILFEYDAS